jgi:hypothetical protein
MWNLWLFGDARNRICPYQYISQQYDLPQRLCKINLSRTKRVINELVAIAIAGGKISKYKDLKDIEISQVVFDYAYPLLLSRLYEGKLPNRPNDININTLANRMKK